MLEQDALHHSEGIRGGRHNVHLLKISIEQSLQELAQKRWTTKYQEWIETISNNVKAYYNEYERQGRTPELLGALQACNDMVTRAKEVVEKVQWFYLVSIAFLASLYNLAECDRKRLFPAEDPRL